LPLHSSYLPLGVPNGLVITTHKDLLLPRQLYATALFWRHHRVAASFLAPLPGRKRRLLRGEFFAHTFFTLLFVLLYFIYFTRSAFYIKNPKKLESLVVVFTLL
jgi:hypothetical protein